MAMVAPFLFFITEITIKSFNSLQSKNAKTIVYIYKQYCHLVTTVSTRNVHHCLGRDVTSEGRFDLGVTGQDHIVTCYNILNLNLFIDHLITAAASCM